MSIFSSILKAVSPALESVPVVGSMLHDAVNNGVQEYEQNKAFDKQTGFQRDMAIMQNNFNAEQADINRQFQSFEADKARQFQSQENLAMLQRSQDFEREMFDKENAYNSPANQLKLLREAGLNPNLMNPSLSSASASSQPSSSVSAVAPSGSSASSGGVPSAPAINNPDVAFRRNMLEESLLRQQEKQLELANRDKENEIEAKERQYHNIYEDIDSELNLHYLSDDGSISVNSYAPTDWYLETYRSMPREQLRSVITDNYRKSLEYRMFSENYDVLKDMDSKRLELLKQQVNSAIQNNTLLSKEVELMKEFGISPNDKDGFVSLLKMALRSPDSFNNVLDALLSAISRTSSNLVGHLGSSPIEVFQTMYDSLLPVKVLKHLK